MTTVSPKIKNGIKQALDPLFKMMSNSHDLFWNVRKLFRFLHND